MRANLPDSRNLDFAVCRKPNLENIILAHFNSLRV